MYPNLISKWILNVLRIRLQHTFVYKYVLEDLEKGCLVKNLFTWTDLVTLLPIEIALLLVLLNLMGKDTCFIIALLQATFFRQWDIHSFPVVANYSLFHASNIYVTCTLSFLSTCALPMGFPAWLSSAQTDWNVASPAFIKFKTSRRLPSLVQIGL